MFGSVLTYSIVHLWMCGSVEVHICKCGCEGGIVDGASV